QELGCGVEENAHISFANTWQILARDRAELAAVPRIGFAGVRMRTEDDDLFAVCQDLDLLLAAVRRPELARDLLEGLVCPQQDRALRCSAETDQDDAALLKMFTR